MNQKIEILKRKSIVSLENGDDVEMYEVIISPVENGDFETLAYFFNEDEAKWYVNQKNTQQ